jgi:hypothetical protein
MKQSSITLAVIAVTSALTACNPPDANRTTKAPPGVNAPTAAMQPLVTPSAPPAPAERGPVPAGANTVAPGTDAAVAFAAEPGLSPGAPAKSTPIAPAAQERAVDAQEAAAKAPDTAAADAAKAEIAGDGKRMDGTARDSAANSPRHGDLTPAEESTQMPKAGQANNYSSPALEKDSGRGRQP